MPFSNICHAVTSHRNMHAYMTGSSQSNIMIGEIANIVYFELYIWVACY